MRKLGKFKIKSVLMYRGRIFSRVRPFYERVVSELDRSMHRYLRALVARSSLIEGLHMTKNMASGFWTKLPCVP
jgi:hypothetical protein